MSVRNLDSACHYFAIDNLFCRRGELLAQCGVPRFIRGDNGPEFVSKAIEPWLQQRQVTAVYVQPGSLWENGYVESFISKLSDEFFNVEEFETVRDSEH